MESYIEDAAADSQCVETHHLEQIWGDLEEEEEILPFHDLDPLSAQLALLE